MSEQKPTVAVSGPAAGQLNIQPPVLQVSSRMLRSPSHESVTSDLSICVSSIASDTRASRLSGFKAFSDAHLSGRGPSPNPDSKLQGNRPADIPEILWFEEETELIRSCGLLSSVLGFQKSFSTSDISQLPSPEAVASRAGRGLRSAVSSHSLELADRDGMLLEQARLDHASRSCSTWVAFGDEVSTSQLPSPHGGSTQPTHPTTQSATLNSINPPLLPFTAADLVRSVNKKVRQNYIRRRLLMTYRALERLSQSEFNLDRLEAAASAAKSNAGATLLVPGAPVAANNTVAGLIPGRRQNRNHALTVKEVERERGKQLLKYERNMMIFNWLHTLDDSVDESAQ